MDIITSQGGTTTKGMPENILPPLMPMKLTRSKTIYPGRGKRKGMNQIQLNEILKLEVNYILSINPGYAFVKFGDIKTNPDKTQEVEMHFIREDLLIKK